MESLLQLYGLAMVVLPVCGFVSLRKKIRDDGMPKSAALLRYIGVVVAPIAGYACLFGLALGVEAVTPFEAISDEAVQTFVLAIVLGMAVWLLATAVFSLGLLFVRDLRKLDLQ
ncbi:MAG: hypothetical protein JSW48_02150 [Betaproteobacteria bacterium]|nr:MAG: hypothetical protein JSW48_02150 [Betaproteobacteria bacterium]